MRGIGFIGDPHLSPRCPARRLDSDYLSTGLGKLQQAMEVCAREHLVPVFLGDLFERPRDRDSRRATEMLSRLLAILAQSPVLPLVLPGNHDMHETQVTEDTHLAVIAASKLIDLLRYGDLREITLEDGRRLAIHACPYGCPIPEMVDAAEGVNVLLTHHDLAFPGSYPGAAPLLEIDGIDWVINGHMHRTQELRVAGKTRYYNPGNIIRQSHADREHVPAVHVFDGESVKVVPLGYAAATEILDASGYQIDAQCNDTQLSCSAFADALQEMRSDRKTGDGGQLLEVIQEHFRERTVAAEHQKIILDLHERAVQSMG